MRFKSTSGYCTGLKHKLVRKKLLHVQLEWRTEYEKRIAQYKKIGSKTYCTSVQSTTTLRKSVRGIKNEHVWAVHSLEKVEHTKFFQELFREDQANP